MSNILSAFSDHRAFLGFLTAGDPSLEKTGEYILEMAKSGADLIQIGVPFSDPTAEGPVVQDANIRALRGGVTTEGVFHMVEQVRRSTGVPLVLFLYLNQVFSYGYQAFFARCKQAGVDGVILPDLPYEEKGELAPIAAEYGVDLISMIVPSSGERVANIAREAAGFLYLMPSIGTAGKELQTQLTATVDAIRAITDTPIAVGIGADTPELAASLAPLADGVIMGSAIVSLIEEHGEKAAPFIGEYVRSMKAAVLQGEAEPCNV